MPPLSQRIAVTALHTVESFSCVLEGTPSQQVKIRLGTMQKAALLRKIITIIMYMVLDVIIFSGVLVKPAFDSSKSGSGAHVPKIKRMQAGLST